MNPIAEPLAELNERAPTPCDRCGAFEALSPSRDQQLCAPCIERLMHPIEQAPLELASLLEGVWQVFRNIWWMALLLVAAFEIPLLLLSYLTPASQFIDRFSWFITILADGAIIFLALQVIEGRTLSVKDALNQTVQRWGAVIWASILSNLVTLFMTLLLIVPGVLRALSYAVVLPIVLHDRGRGTDALSRSAALMEGSRAHVFLAWLILFFPPLVILVAYVGVGIAVDETLINPSLEPTLLFDVLGPAAVVLSLVPLKILPAVIYAKVRRTQDLLEG